MENKELLLANIVQNNIPLKSIVLKYQDLKDDNVLLQLKQLSSLEVLDTSSHLPEIIKEEQLCTVKIFFFFLLLI